MESHVQTKPNIVLVHGAFADGSCWNKIIPPLANAGYNVIAVQNPMTSVADDVAVTRRVIDAMVGPTVVVGHSYGGCVITQAAYGAKNVKALVYLAAFVPDEGQTNGEMLGMYGEPPVQHLLRPDAAGFVTIDRSEFHAAFCADVSDEEAVVMAATQRPIAGGTFGEKCGPVAWKEIPTYYQISENDKTLKPEMEEALAEKIHATTIRLKSSHVAFKSHPNEIVALIEQAASA
jgi:pimeloyl-ACP methyl ester carboxylesterase